MKVCTMSLAFTGVAPAPALTVIVPMLNEAANLPALLAQLAPWRDAGAQVVLVDGGSSDASVRLAQAAGWTVLSAKRGRARQMNVGAAQAQGEWLLFLHADTRLPEQAWCLLQQTMADPRAVWGRFDVRISGQAWMLPVVACMMNWRSRCTGIATGDQAMFVRRAVFVAEGGFPDQPLMEDIELSRRLRARAWPRCLRSPVLTSGRRWENRGVWRTIFLMWRLRWAYWRGVAAEELAKAYQ